MKLFLNYLFRYVNNKATGYVTDLAVAVQNLQAGGRLMNMVLCKQYTILKIYMKISLTIKGFK